MGKYRVCVEYVVKLRQQMMVAIFCLPCHEIDYLKPCPDMSHNNHCMGFEVIIGALFCNVTHQKQQCVSCAHHERQGRDAFSHISCKHAVRLTAFLNIFLSNFQIPEANL